MSYRYEYGVELTWQDGTTEIHARENLLAGRPYGRVAQRRPVGLFGAANAPNDHDWAVGSDRGFRMTARDEAIKAAASAIMATVDLSWDQCDDVVRGYWLLYAAAAVDAVRVPVLLNDLADRIEAERLTDDTGDPEDNGYNCAISDARGIVRAAAEGWGATNG